MKKPLMIFAALIMSAGVQTSAHAEWIDARVTSINSTNQTMQVQHKTSTGISETMTVNLDKNARLEGYQGIGDVRTGDRVRLDVESSFLGTKTARAINASAVEQANPSSDGQTRSGVVGTVNRGLDNRLSTGASARINTGVRTDLPAGGSDANADVNTPTNNNPPKALTSSNSLARSNNSAGGPHAAVRADEGVPSNSFNAQMNTSGNI